MKAVSQAFYSRLFSPFVLGLYSTAMRILTLAISGIALLGVTYLAVATRRVRTDLDETRAQVSELRQKLAERPEIRPAFLRGAPSTPDRHPPPRLNEPLAAQPAPQNSEAGAKKEEIQQIVVDQLAQEREQERQRREQAREERTRRQRERVAIQLGLSPEVAQKFNGVLDSMQQSMRTLRDSVRDGQKTFAEIRPEMDALAERTRVALQELLGNDGLEKLKQMDPGLREGPGDPRGGPGGPPGAPPSRGSSNSNRWLFGLAGGGGPPMRGGPPPSP